MIAGRSLGFKLSPRISWPPGVFAAGTGPRGVYTLVVVVDLSDRDVELATDPVLDALHDAALVLERCRPSNLDRELQDADVQHEEVPPEAGNGGAS